MQLKKCSYWPCTLKCNFFLLLLRGEFHFIDNHRNQNHYYRLLHYGLFIAKIEEFLSVFYHTQTGNNNNSTQNSQNWICSMPWANNGRAFYFKYTNCAAALCVKLLCGMVFGIDEKPAIIHSIYCCAICTLHRRIIINRFYNDAIYNLATSMVTHRTQI